MLGRQKRNLCIVGGVLLMICALSIISYIWILSSKLDFADVKEGTRLHIVKSQTLLQQVQDEAHLICDTTCLESAGKVLIVMDADEYSKETCGYLEGQEKPDDCSTGMYAQRAFTEQPGLVGSTEVASLLCACISGALFVIVFPPLYVVLCCWELDRMKVQQAVDGGHCPTFRMSLSSASMLEHAHLVWGPGGVMRRKLMTLFPCIDICIPFPLYVCAVFMEEKFLLRLIGVSLSAVLIMGRLVILLCFCRYHAWQTARRPETEDIAFFCITNAEVPQVCVVFKQRLTVFHNIGDVPRFTMGIGHLDRIIGRSQLVPQRQDPSDEGSRIVGWSLRVISGTIPKDNEWEVHEHYFPVDPARAHAFRHWLSEEPQRRLFRFCGTAAHRAEVWELTETTLMAPFAAGPGLPELEAGNAAADPNTLPPLDRLETMVLNSRWREEAPGKFSVTLSHDWGKLAAVLTANATDTVADFLREVAVHPCCNSNRVTVVLPDGRTLEKVDARAKLGEVLRSSPV